MAEKTIQIGERINRLTLSQTVILLALLVLTVSLLSCVSEKEVAEDTQKTKNTTRTIPAVTVRAELLAMMFDEQQARDILDSVVAESGWNSPAGKAASAEENRIDSANQIRLKEIVNEYGWPGRSLVGDEAALGAFLILQHADLSLQQKYLPLFEAAAEKGEVAPIHLAMLRDRILMRQDQPQIYGTQLWNDPSTGELGLYPVRDSASVDVRRDSVGLGPIGDYLRSFGIDPDTMTTPTSPYEIIITPSENK